MSTSQTATPADVLELQRSAVRKNGWRFLPILTLAFIINYMDRTSIGFAALTMNHDLGITATQFGFAAGILFASYCLFEIPSNMALYRYGARLWLARIMVTWGLISAATAFVVGPISLYILRILLGIAEAGFFPGVAFLLAAWFPTQYRTRVLAWFILGVPVSSLVGGPISGLLLQMPDLLGLVGWQWMFVLEGLPACIVGLWLYFRIADDPKDATWLTPDEHEALLKMLANEPRSKPRSSLKGALTDRRVLVLTGVQFGFVVGSYGVGMWLPQILRGYDLTFLQIGVLSAVPYIFASVGMLLWARVVDQTGGSLFNLIVACIVAAVGLAGSIVYSTLLPGMIGLTVALIGVTSARAIFWTIPTRFLTGAGAAGGLAFINSVGALGGFVGPFVLGGLRDATGSFSIGILAMAGMLIVSSALAATLWGAAEQRVSKA